MTCDFSDTQLLAYLDGDAAPGVAAVIERSAACRQRLDTLARQERRLTAALYRVQCPSPQRLGDYHLQLLDGAQAATIARHLATCPHCTREVARLRSFLAGIRPDLELTLAERVRVLVARLVPKLPPLGQPAPTWQVRGGEERVRVYEAGEAQVTLAVQDDAGRPGRKIVLGLVLGLDSPALMANLWRAGEHAAAAEVNELGNFVVSGLIPGDYELIIGGPEVEIHIQSLEI